MNNTLFWTLLWAPEDRLSHWKEFSASNAIQELLLKSKERDTLRYQNIDFDTEFLRSDDKVASLLAQYDLYASIAVSTDHADPNSASTRERLQSIWDAMKYDNPYIWLKYKLLAYKDQTDKRIETIGDLLSHCSPEWYICWKRLHFLHRWLLEYSSLDIYDLDPNTRIEDFLQDPSVESISRQRDFMLEWLYYEYYQVWDKVMKWSNYNQTKHIGIWAGYKRW